MSSQGEGTHLAPKGGSSLEPWREDLILYLQAPHRPGTLSGQSWLPWPLFEASSHWGSHPDPLPPPPSLFVLVSSYCRQSLTGGHEEWKRGEFSLSGRLRCLFPNLGLHHLYEVGLGFALYPHIFLYLTHLDRRGVAKTLGRNFWGLKAVEDFKIVFEFRNVNYLFLLLNSRL